MDGGPLLLSFSRAEDQLEVHIFAAFAATRERFAREQRHLVTDAMPVVVHAVNPARQDRFSDAEVGRRKRSVHDSESPSRAVLVRRSRSLRISALVRSDENPS